jgi:hypothetical protein
MPATRIVEAVRQAFFHCDLPVAVFAKESDLRAFLLPAMRSSIREGVLIRDTVRRVPDFVPAEQIRPDGEAVEGSISVALELKLLRGRRNNDAGELHRGLGQCLAYAASEFYAASVLLVVHEGAIRPEARGLPLLSTPGEIVLATEPPRRVLMFNRWRP